MSNFKAMIIAGHGGTPYDSGAIGNGYKEAELTRELSKLVAAKLKSYGTVDLYDMSKDVYKECKKGTFKIGSYDYVLEIHFNSFNTKAYGTEIYVTPREAGIGVEQDIMSYLGRYFTVRGVKREDFLVINTIKSKGISSALLEVCFIDNANDMKVYQANKDNIAQAIVNGIVSGFGLTAAREYYIVQKGDTLYSIARKYNTKVTNLVLLNNIKNPSLISIGQKIYLT